MRGREFGNGSYGMIRTEQCGMGFIRTPETVPVFITYWIAEESVPFPGNNGAKRGFIV